MKVHVYWMANYANGNWSKAISSKYVEFNYPDNFSVYYQLYIVIVDMIILRLGLYRAGWYLAHQN